MNKMSESVLSAIVAASPNGESVIIEKDELNEAIPANLNPKEGDLDKIMKELVISELITIKYKDANVYCVAAHNKAMLFTKKVEPLIMPDSTVNFKFNYKKIARVSFVSSLLGGLLAGAIIVLILYFTGRL